MRHQVPPAAPVHHAHPLSRRRRVLSRLLAVLATVAAALAAGSPATAIDTTDTRLLAEPAVSRDHVAFSYAGDLWVAQINGNHPRRLTSHPGNEWQPRFSHDGQWIAFTGEYDGNADVYLIPTGGGEPRRLTWHPGGDLVQGFTTDDRAVLFTSRRSSHTRAHTHLYSVPLEGGFPTRVPLPHAAQASISPDGSKIAYVPLREPFRQWKHYRGGRYSRIWIYDRADQSVMEIPQPDGRCNDTDPVWLGRRVYFLSDRAGEFNLFAFDPVSGQVSQLTRHEDFPVLDADAAGNFVVYEQAGWLHRYDTSNGRADRLSIGIATDLVETRPRWESDEGFIRAAQPSPSGARVALEYRGEILTVPAEHGSPRNLTETVAAHERSPAWSPDGTRVAYVSDASGEYALHIASRDGQGEPRAIPLQGAGFYEDLKWSPDGTRISFTDNSWTLYVLEVASGTVKTVASEPVYGPIKTLHHAWSPDSRWLAYTLNTPVFLQQVHVYSVEEDFSHLLTDGLADVTEPVFDTSGEFLWLAASTDAGPVRQWFAMSNADMERTNALYLVVLSSDAESPLKPRVDEESDATGSDSDEPNDDAPETGGEAEAPPAVRIDFEGIEQRIVAVPVPTAFYWNLHPGPAGELYYLQRDRLGTAFGGTTTGTLSRFQIETRETETLLDGVESFQLTADGKTLLLHQRGAWHLASAGKKITPGDGRLATGNLRVRIDPRAEWAQIFDEAWRINRDYFYDPGMHGADWPAMKEKYRDFLPHLADREDLNRVIRWMSSELAVGHHRVGGGDTPWDVEDVPGGLLGADLEVHENRYRFSEVYGGLNWNPDLRSPLTEPGVDVRAGEYLLAVNGQPLEAPANPYRPFENTAGEVVEITVGPDPDGSDARTVRVLPLRDEAALRNRAWVEGNLARVTEATDGRVAYVYVPNTANRGHTYFKRYFFPQADRQAIIVDERHNAGGQIADYAIDLLRRPHLAWWTTRYGADLPSPLGAIHGPKVMLIDETAGSGGDMLPWMWRQLEIGPLVGRPTWGGLVGVLGFPTLMDGGFITAPNIGIWTEDGFVVENEGVAPDVEVEQWPAEVMAGRDPQLEKAIEMALEMLEENPPPRPQRPPFPNRANP